MDLNKISYILTDKFSAIGRFVGPFKVAEGVGRAESLYGEKGDEANTEDEAELRHCAVLALKLPYKSVLSKSARTAYNLFTECP